MKDLLSLSYYIGNNWMLSQATGGNTSFKDNGTNLIKASGRSLTETNKNNKQLFVDMDGTNGKPSMEVQFHSDLDWKYVCHYHSISFLVFSVLGEEVSSTEILGIKNISLDYFEPGEELAKEIRKRKEKGELEKVYFLHNHGIIVCSDYKAEVIEIIEIIECFLRSRLKEMGVDIFKIVSMFVSGNKVSVDHLTKSLVNNKKYLDKGLRLLEKGDCFFPDQAVYLNLPFPNLLKKWHSSYIRSDLSYYDFNIYHEKCTKEIIEMHYSIVVFIIATAVGLSQKNKQNSLKKYRLIPSKKCEKLRLNLNEIYRKKCN